jgi:hypothetical protein
MPVRQRAVALLEASLKLRQAEYISLFKHSIFEAFNDI